eukprot:1159881-Pelagomonas_calceolata.AAC.11
MANAEAPPSAQGGPKRGDLILSRCSLQGRGWFRPGAACKRDTLTSLLAVRVTIYSHYLRVHNIFIEGPDAPQGSGSWVWEAS